MSATKRQRYTTLDSIQAPVGFHYEGTPCCMYEGRTTRRLRRDVEGTREEIYSDLYCRSDIHEGGKLKVNYLCCISGCPKPVVSMFVTSSGSVVFQNFSKHLAVNHEEYLFEADRSFSMQSTQPTTNLLLLNMTTESKEQGSWDHVFMC